MNQVDPSEKKEECCKEDQGCVDPEMMSKEDAVAGAAAGCAGIATNDVASEDDNDAA